MCVSARTRVHEQVHTRTCALWGLQTGYQLKWEARERDSEGLGSSYNRLGFGTWLGVLCDLG